MLPIIVTLLLLSDGGLSALNNASSSSKLTNRLLSITDYANVKLIDVELNISSNDLGAVEFRLYNKELLTAPILSTMQGNNSLFDRAFNPSLVTKVIIHGWMNDNESPFEKLMIENYLSNFEYNVIAVSWADAYNINYAESRYKVLPVGKVVARFIDRLIEQHAISSARVHLIGHSLGAHISGVASNHVISGKVANITGLDPALPLFISGGEDTLNANDADFVVIVHSCIGVLGIPEAIGHIDFYPNGGSPLQPGCLVDINCSHARSFEYYAEAIINPTLFKGTQCGSWLHYGMGLCSRNNKVYLNEEIDTSARGMYFLKTGSAPPYGLGDES